MQEPCRECRPEEWEAFQDERAYADANIPRRFWKVTFQNFKSHTPEQEAAKSALIDYVCNLGKNILSGRGVTLWGSVGSGKTHLACALLRNIIAAERKRKGVETTTVNGETVAVLRPPIRSYFISEDGIFDRFKREWNDPEEEAKFLMQLQRRRFLVIDDLGIRKPTDYVTDRYEAIINTRYANNLPTIVTTNHSPEDLAEDYERQMSRLAGNLTLKIFGPDMRGARL
jgi:DNA replication protein DnaC